MALPPKKSFGGVPRPRSQSRSRFQEFNNEEHRLNERIRVPEIRLIDENGGQVGIVKTADALRMAKDKGLDLMEVAPNSRPPVCKITDYGKFKYEKKKKEHAAKKKQVIMKVKEIQLRPSTDKHDLDFKVRNLRSFLEDGDKAKITILFRGREITHAKDVGKKIVDEVLEQVKDISDIESGPQMEGRKMILILAPQKKKVPKKASSGGESSEKGSSERSNKKKASSDKAEAVEGS